jgi:hypothetical protein
MLLFILPIVLEDLAKEGMMGAVKPTTIPQNFS